ncbi:hypothetical protein WDW86_20795 [Bdellovibrionota bacterium FG-2]
MLFHEYVHHLLSSKSKRLPLWLEEGLAQAVTYEILNPRSIPRLQEGLKSAPGIVFHLWTQYEGIQETQIHGLYAQSYAFVSWLFQRLSMKKVIAQILKDQPQSFDELEQGLATFLDGERIQAKYSLRLDFALALLWNSPLAQDWFVTPYYQNLTFAPELDVMAPTFQPTEMDLSSPEVPFFTIRSPAKALCARKSQPGIVEEVAVKAGKWNGKSAARTLCPRGSDFAVLVY